ncbi:DNRLRE domain-containing protein, partial [archaeon]|nr:DNRLRE domain-containing protein [archaeon]
NTNRTLSDNPPTVTINAPTAGTEFNQTFPVAINATVDDDMAVHTVIANISTPSGQTFLVPLTPQPGSTYTGAFVNTTTIGRYNITVIANDTSGNVNNTEKTWFNVTFYLPVLNGNLNNVSTQTTVLQDHGGGIVDVEVLPINYTILNITIYGYNTTAMGTLYINNETADQDFHRTYSIDLSNLRFSTADVTLTAQGNYLHKCLDFNFTAQNCNDISNYTLIRQDLIPGQNYTITLTRTDPGFGEVVAGPADINDSYIISSSQNTNYGTLTLMRVGRATAGSISRGALRFELPDLPPGAVVTNVEAQLYFFRIPAGDTTTARTHGIYKVQQSPPRNWTERGVTWNNYTATAAWTAAGGDYNATPTDTKNLSSAQLNSFISYNVTSDVRNFYENMSSNFGWIVRDTLENVNNARRDYRSKEAADPAQRPRLVINYTDAEAPQWSNQGQNDSNPDVGGAVKLYTQWTDNKGLSTAILATNETGTWQNKTGAGPNDLYGTEGTSNGPIRGSENYESCSNITITRPFNSVNITARVDYVAAGGDLWFRVRNDLAGLPGTPVASCNAPDPTGSDEWESCTANNDSTQSAGTYWVCAYSSTGATGTAYFNINYGTDAGYTAARYETTAWTTYSDISAVIRADFSLYGSPLGISGSTNWSNFTWQNANTPLGTVVGWRIHANDTSENWNATSIMTFAYGVVDITPPATVTNLNEQYIGGHWIQWSWTNPSDTDLNHVEVWVNGTFYANVSAPTNYYNASSLVQNTMYEIQTRTADHNGNINTTWVNDTARTLTLNGTIQLDRFSYEQGETVYITGQDWDSYNDVTLDTAYNGTSIPGYPKNVTANSTAGISDTYHIPLNASLGIYNVTAMQPSNASKNDIEQFNVSPSTAPPPFQPLRAGLELYIYLPPLHNPFGARPEDPFLFVTAFNDD